MSKKIILFGSEIIGREAINYFGSENVECFCDNNIKNVGKIVEGRPVVSFDELLVCHKDAFVVVSASRNSYRAIENQLECNGIKQHIWYVNLKKWIDGESSIDDFMDKWISIDKFGELRVRVDQYSEICKLRQQVEFFKTHTDIRNLLPAKGELREYQLKMTSIAKQFSDFSDSLGAKVFFIGGNLIGTVRHKGYVPWDDDVDFGIMRYDFNKLIKYFEEKKTLYTSDSLIDFTNEDLGKLLEKHPNEFVGYRRQNFLKVIYGTCKEDMLGIDVWVFDYFADDYSIDEYKKFLEDINAKRATISSIRERIKIIDEMIANNPNVSLEQTSKIYYAPDSNWALITIDRGKWLYTRDIMPLKRAAFEEIPFWVPNRPEAYLELEYPNYLEYPNDVGIISHQ